MPADKNCVPFSGEKETQFFYIFTGMTGIHAGIIDYQRMGTRIIWQIVILGQEEQPESVFFSALAVHFHKNGFAQAQQPQSG